MEDRFDLSGRVALVTGASQGLGRRFAEVLAGHGAAVGLAARQIDRLEDLRSELHAAGRPAASVRLDVTDQGAIEAAIDTVEAALGPIDILINNAGLALGRTLVSESSDEDDRRMFETNVLGLVRMTRLVLPHMEDGRGHIVNLAHRLAEQGQLRPGVSEDRAMQMIQLLSSYETYDHLHRIGGMRTETIAGLIVEMADHAVLADGV